MKNKIPIYGYFGLLIILISFILPNIRLGVYNFKGDIFALGLIFFVIALNSKSINSVHNIISDKRYINLIKIITYGIFLGIIYEIIGQFLLKQWTYEIAKYSISYNLVMFFYWGIFCLLVHECYTYLSRFFKIEYFVILVTALVLMILIEGFNLITRDWTYVIKNPVLIYVGWVILILTFYTIPNKLKIFN